jgi:uncharacterized membrane protein YecN with MAPEG domain
MLPITSLFAGLSALMLLALSLNVIRLRWQHRLLIGDTHNETIFRASRAQSNFLEYVPICLIMMALLEAQNIRLDELHTLGIILLVGRASHAYSMIFHENMLAGSHLFKRIPFRSIGMACTFYVLIAEAHWLLTA